MSDVGNAVATWTCRKCWRQNTIFEKSPGMICPCEGVDTAHFEQVDRPPHYNKSPSGVEAIVVLEHMNFNVGNAMKYLWRAGEKGSGGKRPSRQDTLRDLRKAAWYVDREIQRVSASGPELVMGEEPS